VNVPRIALVALISAVVGTLLDRIQTYFGVLEYARPCFCGEACLVPLIMAGAGIAMVVTPSLFRMLFGQAPDGTLVAVVIGSVDLVAAYIASGLFQGFPVALTVGYAVFAVFRLSRDPRPARVATAVTALVVGMLAELGLTQIGFFTYLHPNILGMPYWIGALYVFAGLVGFAVDNRWPMLTPSLRAPLNP
jgi:hypothetical protein